MRHAWILAGIGLFAGLAGVVSYYTVGGAELGLPGSLHHSQQHFPVERLEPGERKCELRQKEYARRRIRWQHAFTLVWPLV
jgi:hypothetical protein